MNRLRILLVEPDSRKEETIKQSLGEAGIVCDLHRVGTPADLSAALERDSPDLILANAAAPGFAGASPQEIAHRRRPDVPCLLMAGNGNGGQAADYVVQSPADRLLPAVQRAVREFQERAGRKLAEQALAEADPRQDEFLGVLSHELRTPLAPIRNGLYLLRLAHLTNPVVRESINVLERQVQHLAQIVDNLVDVFRITHHKLPLRPKELDLGPLICRAVEDHRDILQNAGLQVTVEVPEDPVWVWGDAARLSQVVGHLLSNAVKFTKPEGCVRVCVLADNEARQATVSVRDTGTGVSADLLPEIFDIFVQGKQTLERSRGGLGLGLALVKMLVELHGGSVRTRPARGPAKGRKSRLRFR